MKHCDVAIVGGSFSGLACAKESARQGLNTQVFERKKRPGSYTQSTGIFVKEIAEKLNIPAQLTRKISGVRLYAPDMRYLDLSSPDYYFLATDTGGVLDWMACQAEQAGATINTSTHIKTIERRDNRIVLNDQGLSCSYLVASDGANSELASQMGFGNNRYSLSGAEYEVDGFDEVDSDKLHVFLSSRFAPGYIGWLIKGVHVTQIGIAVKPGNVAKIKPFYEFLKSHFSTDSMIISGRGGPIPCGGLVTPWANKYGCLLGDAAGMVSPLTAGGIHPSIEIGEQLGIAIAQYLYGNSPVPHEQISSIIKRYPFKKYLRHGFNKITPPDALLNYGLSNSIFQRIAQTIFFHNRGLLSAKAWSDILHISKTTS